MNLWLCPLIAFLCGSVPFGLLFGKALEEPVAKLRDGGHEKYSC